MNSYAAACVAADDGDLGETRPIRGCAFGLVGATYAQGEIGDDVDRAADGQVARFAVGGRACFSETAASWCGYAEP
ncbi:MAG: hypothetical protein GX230_05325 [Lentisphaerae bacterium]|nr:hypothetical protein [Lentisphaerota bacterium]